SLNRLPIVVRIIVKHDAPGAATLKDDAVAGFSHDIVLYLVSTVPMVELDSVITSAVVTAADVEIVMPVFVSITKLCPDMGRAGAIGPAGLKHFDALNPTKLAELHPD